MPVRSNPLSLAALLLLRVPSVSPVLVNGKKQCKTKIGRSSSAPGDLTTSRARNPQTLRSASYPSQPLSNQKRPRRSVRARPAFVRRHAPAEGRGLSWRAASSGGLLSAPPGSLPPLRMTSWCLRSWALPRCRSAGRTGAAHP